MFGYDLNNCVVATSQQMEECTARSAPILIDTYPIADRTDTASSGSACKPVRNYLVLRFKLYDNAEKACIDCQNGSDEDGGGNARRSSKRWRWLRIGTADSNRIAGRGSGTCC